MQDPLERILHRAKTPEGAASRPGLTRLSAVQGGELRRADVAAARDQGDPPAPERSASFSAAASGAAPAGSTRLRVCSIISRVASRISSSLTSTKSSRCSQRICCGSSNGTRVARPSANVEGFVLDYARACHERKAAGAASDWTPITSISGRIAFATTHAPAAPLPPPIGTTITSTSGRSSTISSVSVPTPAIRSGSLPEWT